MKDYVWGHAENTFLGPVFYFWRGEVEQGHRSTARRDEWLRLRVRAAVGTSMYGKGGWNMNMCKHKFTQSEYIKETRATWPLSGFKVFTGPGGQYWSRGGRTKTLNTREISLMSLKDAAISENLCSFLTPVSLVTLYIPCCHKSHDWDNLPDSCILQNLFCPWAFWLVITLRGH